MSVGVREYRQEGPFGVSIGHLIGPRLQQQDSVYIKHLPRAYQAHESNSMLTAAFAYASSDINHLKEKGIQGKPIGEMAGTTATMAIVNSTNMNDPNDYGSITIATMGDSPAALFVYDEITGTTTAHYLNAPLHDLDNTQEYTRILSTPGVTSIIRKPKQMISYNGEEPRGFSNIRAFGQKKYPYISDKPEIKTIDVNQYLPPMERRNGKQRVFFASLCDGIAGKSGAPQLHDYLDTISNYLNSGGNPEQLGALLADTAEAKGSQDNLSAIVTEIKPLRETSLMVGVADGHEPDGEIVSKTATDAIASKMDELMLGIPAPVIPVEPVAALPIVDKDKYPDVNLGEGYWLSARAYKEGVYYRVSFPTDATVDLNSLQTFGEKAKTLAAAKGITLNSWVFSDSARFATTPQHVLEVLGKLKEKDALALYPRIDLDEKHWLEVMSRTEKGKNEKSLYYQVGMKIGSGNIDIAAALAAKLGITIADMTFNDVIGTERIWAAPAEATLKAFQLSQGMHGAAAPVNSTANGQVDAASVPPQQPAADREDRSVPLTGGYSLEPHRNGDNAVTYKLHVPENGSIRQGMQAAQDLGFVLKTSSVGTVAKPRAATPKSTPLYQGTIEMHGYVPDEAFYNAALQRWYPPVDLSDGYRLFAYPNASGVAYTAQIPDGGNVDAAIAIAAEAGFTLRQITVEGTPYAVNTADAILQQRDAVASRTGSAAPVAEPSVESPPFAEQVSMPSLAAAASAFTPVTTAESMPPVIAPLAPVIHPASASSGLAQAPLMQDAIPPVMPTGGAARPFADPGPSEPVITIAIPQTVAPPAAGVPNGGLVVEVAVNPAPGVVAPASAGDPLKVAAELRVPMTPAGAPDRQPAAADALMGVSPAAAAAGTPKPVTDAQFINPHIGGNIPPVPFSPGAALRETEAQSRAAQAEQRLKEESEKLAALQEQLRAAKLELEAQTDRSDGERAELEGRLQSIILESERLTLQLHGEQATREVTAHDALREAGITADALFDLKAKLERAERQLDAAGEYVQALRIDADEAHARASEYAAEVVAGEAALGRAAEDMIAQLNSKAELEGLTADQARRIAELSGQLSSASEQLRVFGTTANEKEILLTNLQTQNADLLANLAAAQLAGTRAEQAAAQKEEARALLASQLEQAQAQAREAHAAHEQARQANTQEQQRLSGEIQSATAKVGELQQSLEQADTAGKQLALVAQSAQSEVLRLTEVAKLEQEKLTAAQSARDTANEALLQARVDLETKMVEIRALRTQQENDAATIAERDKQLGIERTGHVLTQAALATALAHKNKALSGREDANNQADTYASSAALAAAEAAARQRHAELLGGQLSGVQGELTAEQAAHGQTRDALNEAELRARALAEEKEALSLANRQAGEAAQVLQAEAQAAAEALRALQQAKDTSDGTLKQAEHDLAEARKKLAAYEAEKAKQPKKEGTQPDSAAPQSDPEKAGNVSRGIMALVASAAAFIGLKNLFGKDEEETKTDAEQKESAPKQSGFFFKLVSTVTLGVVSAVGISHTVTGGQWKPTEGKEGIAAWVSRVTNFAGWTNGRG